MEFKMARILKEWESSDKIITLVKGFKLFWHCTFCWYAYFLSF